jgi:hypothetical protein
MGMIKMFSVHVNNVVLLYLPWYLAQVLGLFPIPSECRLHKKVFEESFERIALLRVVALVDAGDAYLLILPDHLLIILLIRRHIDQLLLDLRKDLDANARSAHLLKVSQYIDLCWDNYREMLNEEVYLGGGSAASRGLFHYEVEKV